MGSSVEATYSLSPMQHGMLFQHIAGQQPGIDVEQILFELREVVDVQAMAAAWQLVVDRHAPLRTGFRWEGLVDPRQDVYRAVRAPFEVQDWSALDDEAELEERFQSYVAADRTRGFDLASPPLTRLLLARVTHERFWGVWTFPHILLDGRSFPIVLNDLFSIYEAARAGSEAGLPPPRPYASFLDWLRGNPPSGAAEFWGELLRGFDAPTPLPSSQPARSVGSTSSGDRERRLSRDLTERLRSLADAAGVTLPVIVQGAWALLLARYSGETDVVFGATRACRRGTVRDADSIAGLFINTLPVRVRVEPEVELVPWLREIRAQQRSLARYEHTPLVDVMGCSGLPRRTSLFDSLVVFDHETVATSLRKQGPRFANRDFRLVERNGYPLTLYAYGELELLLTLRYEHAHIDDSLAAQVLGHLACLMEQMAQTSRSRLREITMLSDAERRKLLEAWNATNRPIPGDALVHQLIESQAELTPDAPALVWNEQAFTYQELNGQANQLAHHLRGLGVGPDMLVGVATRRDVEMLVATLAVLKAGGAYLPLDHSYPAERIRMMLEDSGVSILLTQEGLLAALPPTAARVLCLDRDRELFSRQPTHNLDPVSRADHLAYVIYTSGSTGRPKGVMVEHRNVVNFFTGMDAWIERPSHGAQPGVWLAVTSLSFDISVLELLWTLSRGFKVVLHAGQANGSNRQSHRGRPMCFGVFYFASDGGTQGRNCYELLLEGARIADRRGFDFVSIPERHFHAFGGLYPNPSVAAAAIAAITDRIQIRAGSVVMPLHDPIRVAEEWSVVDNLSGGRVAIAFASGWQPNDFLLSPDAYRQRKELTTQGIEQVRALWRGEGLTRRNPMGEEVEVHTLPRPVQPELPVWITTAGDIETWRTAGVMGANVLTHLLGQTVDQVAEKVEAYRKARSQQGHDGSGTVTLMLHTLVGQSDEAVRETVRAPMKRYLASSVSLIKGFISSFPAFRKPEEGRPEAEEIDLSELSEEEMDAILEHSFERYFEASALFGSPARCLAMVDRLRAAGVDEIACLIDFGVEADVVLDSLALLDEVRLAANEQACEQEEFGVDALIQRHGVTHMQCTPSMAFMLLLDRETRRSLARLRTMVIGGEAFPAALARELRRETEADLINAYGPTETTIWSTCHRVDSEEDIVPIGRPIANTELYVLDSSMQPVPVGVPGELYIGGSGVVRGYFGQPVLTAERFVPHPFSGAEAGARLYRTGDLVRYRQNGCLEFLGRLDQQVKVRGHRIELGEIESAILACDGVAEAVAVVREDAPGDQALVAYFTARDEASGDVELVRQRLRAQLPEFMLPSAVVLLDAMPRTPNAKLDRKRLPSPREAARRPGEGREPPADEFQRLVAGVWQEVLGLSGIGADGNFFDLGGHSLLTVRVQSKLRERLGRRIPVTDLFRFPTVRSLAKHLAGGPSSEPGGRSGQKRAEKRRAALARRLARGSERGAS